MSPRSLPNFPPTARHSQLRIFDMAMLNDPAGKQEILEFCGFADPETLVVHENRNP